ncbi:MAG: copper chaperone PCu(A)C [Alphaproteobacteria bacterium]|nr:copper chaperone PCu(A)C [Alphaproteobacteria bacterium]
MIKYFLFPIAATIFLLAPCDAAFAQDKDATITIKSAYAFATTTQAKTGAAFMDISNHSAQDDRLINVESNIANITEIHENYIDPDDGMMMMRKISGIDIKTGKTVTLEPTGYHVMLIDLKEPLAKDTSFPLTLHFEKAEPQTVSVDILTPGTKPEHTPCDHHK